MAELLELIKAILIAVAAGAAMIPVGVMVKKRMVHNKLYKDPQFRLNARIASMGEKGEGMVISDARINKIVYGRIGGRVWITGTCANSGNPISDSMTFSRFDGMRVLYLATKSKPKARK